MDGFRVEIDGAARCSRLALEWPQCRFATDDDQSVRDGKA
jgi:hypothetical protein